MSATEPVTDPLARERDHLLATFARVPEARRAVRPSAGAWSALEILEHCARVEGGVAKLLGIRAALLGAYAATPDAVLDGAVHPHPFIGLLTLRAWVQLIAHHDARHAEQMGEVAGHWAPAT